MGKKGSMQIGLNSIGIMSPEKVSSTMNVLKCVTNHIVDPKEKMMNASGWSSSRNDWKAQPLQDQHHHHYLHHHQQQHQHHQQQHDQEQEQKDSKGPIFRIRKLHQWPMGEDMIATAPLGFFQDDYENNDSNFSENMFSIFRSQQQQCHGNNSPSSDEQDYLTIQKANPIYENENNMMIPTLKQATPINFEYWTEYE